MRSQNIKSIGLRRFFPVVGESYFSETIPATSASSGTLDITSINGTSINSFDMIQITLIDITMGGTGLMGRIEAYVSPDGGSTLRSHSGARITNNITNVDWNTYGVFKDVCVQDGGTHYVTAMLFRNFDNTSAPTTIQYFNHNQNRYHAAGVFSDAILGNFLEESHNLIRLKFFDTTPTLLTPTGGSVYITGWKAGKRTTTKITPSASSETINIPANHTMGQIVTDINTVGSTYINLRCRSGGTLISGITDYSYAKIRKGSTYVFRDSKVAITSFDTAKTTAHSVVINLWNLNIQAPFYFEGLSFEGTAERSKVINALLKTATLNTVDAIDIYSNDGSNMSGTIWLTTYEKPVIVESFTAPGTSNSLELSSVAYTNGAYLVTSTDAGTTANTTIGLQASQATSWLSAGNRYRNMFMYSIGVGSTSTNITSSYMASSTSHGFALNILSSSWGDDNGNFGSLPTNYFQTKHIPGANEGNGARLESDVIFPSTQEKIDKYRVTHLAASSTFVTGTYYVTQYNL